MTALRLRLRAAERAVLQAAPWLRPVWRRSFGVAAQLRRGLLTRLSLRRRRHAYAPLVSAIVPNFNHARFLPQRLESILRQRYGRVEIIVLDDASTDDSLAVIERFRAAHPDRVRVVPNARNSGSVFRQWQRGVEAATGEVLWICESDDFADHGFLDALVPALADDSVLLAFGRVEFADDKGWPSPGLDAYRERAEPGIWSRPLVRGAKAWFDGAFGVSNVIPNVGGCLIRRQPVEPEIWAEAARYRVLGDWFLYAMLARGGRIAYVPDAVAYFRQHGANTSVGSFATAGYYAEHERLLALLRQRWGVPAATVARFAANVRTQYERAGAAAAIGPLAPSFDPTRALAVRRTARHVLIVILGFYLGGGELFPIHLANQLVQMGWLVSVMPMLAHGWDGGIRDLLDRRIPLYPAPLVGEAGLAGFAEGIGVDLIHSHSVQAELAFLTTAPPGIPYVVTLHGSYAVTNIAPATLQAILRQVTRWIPLTPRNLACFDVLDRATRDAMAISDIPNGMPPDPRPFDRDRAELGIAAEDLVFAIVSRALPEKGWAIAVAALALAQARTQRRLVLLLAGTGPEAERLAKLHGGAAVILLGFQDRVEGLYRLADCALLPTRFPGESFPLTLIQALQAGCPVVATEVGEIGRMIAAGGRRAGLLLPPLADDGAFAAALAGAMLTMADDAARAAFGRDAKALGEGFGMAAVAAQHAALYEELVA